MYERIGCALYQIYYIEENGIVKRLSFGSRAAAILTVEQLRNEGKDAGFCI